MKYLVGVLLSLVGGFIGYFVVLYGYGLTTGSNLSGLLGLICGLPGGMAVAVVIYSLALRSKK
jgi:Na+-driven multidrug efflux pump